MTDCVHGLAEGTCAMCHGDSDDAPPLLGSRTTARFEGRCVRCDDPILEGDRIVFMENGWSHEECD